MTKNYILQIKSINFNFLFMYSFFLKKTFKKLAIKSSSTIIKSIKLYTLLKSPHVFKKARKQFQITTFIKTMTIYSEIKTFHLKFLLFNKPHIVKLTIKKFNNKI